MAYSNTTVIIPTLNEEKNISKLVGLIENFYPGISVTVADDGSKDQTPQIVRKLHKKNPRIILLDRSDEKIHGLTASAVAGAKSSKTENVVVIDGDLQHPPEKIGEVIEKLKHFNVVVGTRSKGFLEQLNFSRFTISKTATIMAQIRLLFNSIHCRDPMSGFFGIKTELIKKIDDKYFEMEGYKILFDLMKRLPKGMRLGEVFYDFEMRKEGSTKLSRKHMKIFFRSLFK